MNSERHIASLVLLGAAAFGLMGCEAHAQGAAYSQADAPNVAVDGPSLVEVDAGVWVVQDNEEPIYFIDDDYWVFRSGVWYRSHAYNGGWIVVEERAVPQVIVHRDHRQYVHFHGGATAHRRPAPHRDAEKREANEHHDEGRPHEEGRHDEGHHDEGHHEEAHENREEHRDAHAEHREEKREEKREERGKKKDKKK